jgi:hypothetical protein
MGGIIMEALSIIFGWICGTIFGCAIAAIILKFTER